MKPNRSTVRIRLHTAQRRIALKISHHRPLNPWQTPTKDEDEDPTPVRTKGSRKH